MGKLVRVSDDKTLKGVLWIDPIFWSAAAFDRRFSDRLGGGGTFGLINREKNRSLFAGEGHQFMGEKGEVVVSDPVTDKLVPYPKNKALFVQRGDIDLTSPGGRVPQLREPTAKFFYRIQYRAHARNTTGYPQLWITLQRSITLSRYH